MGTEINNAFDEYQKELSKRSRCIKYMTSFESQYNMDNVVDELMKKEVIL